MNDEEIVIWAVEVLTEDMHYVETCLVKADNANDAYDKVSKKEKYRNMILVQPEKIIIGKDGAVLRG